MIQPILHNSFFLILLSSVLWLSACGDDDGAISERLSGPEASSVLPMRIDATVTPTETESPFENEFTPEPEETPEPQNMFNSVKDEQKDRAEPEEREASELETRLSLMTPPPEELPERITPEPSAESSELGEETITPTPSVTPSPSPKLTPASETESAMETAIYASPSPTQNSPKTQAAESEKTPGSQDALQDRTGQTVPAKKSQISSSKKLEVQHVSTDIELDKLVVCSALSNRTPSGIAEEFSFSKVKKVYTWMRVSGAKPPITMKHSYYREGKLVASVSLEIKYSSMRTWSQKTFKGPEAQGDWKVVVTTQDGEVLAEKEFSLAP